MAPLGFIEILDSKGGVAERIPVTAFPVRIGRAYANDVILDDPYVCPAHLAIAPDAEGRLIARDLNSLNGLRRDASGARIAALELRSGSSFRIGHTQLRYCSVDHTPPATRPDRAASERRTGYAAAISAASIFLLLCAEAYLGSVERITAAALFAEPLATIATVLVWAGLWALGSRVLVGQLHFARHLMIACSAVAAFFVLNFAAEWLEFLIPAVPAMWAAGIFAAAIIVAALIYAHLEFASAMQHSSRAWAALSISAALAGVSLVSEFASRSKFSNVMEFTSVVKPLDAALLPAIGVEEFIAGTATLKHDLQTLAAKARVGQP